MKLIRLTTFALFGLGLAVGGVNASADAPPLPQEGFDACSGKNAGDACSVSCRGHEMSGTCGQVPASDKLFCRPSGPPPLLQEGIDACSGKKAGDACSVSLTGLDVSGTCIQVPSSDKLFCHLSAPPPPAQREP